MSAVNQIGIYLHGSRDLQVTRLAVILKWSSRKTCEEPALHTVVKPASKVRIPNITLRISNSGNSQATQIVVHKGLSEKLFMNYL